MMRKIRKYPAEVKEAAMRRYLQGGATYAEVGAEFDVKPSTLTNWLSEARDVTKQQRKNRAKRRAVSGRSAAAKMNLLLKAAALSEQDKGAFLRHHGLRDGDLERFERETTALLKGEDSPATKARVKRIERELAKTAARLREAEALLELQKKVQALWRDSDEGELADGSDE